MKTAITIIVCLVIAISGQTQTPGLQLPLTDKQKVFYLKNGFPINEYDFQNSYINEQLVLAWRLREKSNTKIIFGSGMTILGTALIITGAMIEEPKISNDPFLIPFEALGAMGSSLAKGGQIGLGVVSIAVSFPILISGSKSNQKIITTLQSARQLHREQNLKSKE
jgi:hypothetical protein